MIYVVQFEKSTQITEDSWRVSRPSLQVYDGANLRDILEWAVSQNGNRMPEKIEIRELQSIDK